MRDSLSIARSGLQASATRMAASASNIANLRTSGKLTTPETAYQPQSVSLKAEANGGVSAVTSPVDPATLPAYAPSDANADENGLVAMPNVSLENEILDGLMATTGYRANASVIRTLQAMDRSLLDIKT